MKKIFFIFFVLFSYSAFAQEPAMLSLKGIGGNNDDQVGSWVTKTQDGGFVIGIGTNSTYGTGNIDSFSLCTTSGDYASIFVKYNSDASIVEWSKCYGQNGDSAFGYIFPTNDDGVVLGGEYSTTASGYGFLIMKEDALGNVLWSHSYSKGNGPLLRDMIATSDGGYIMIGDVYYTDTNFMVHASGSLNADIGVMKLDSLGNKVWSKAIGGSLDEISKAVLEVGSEYYIVGSTSSDDSDCTGNHGAYDAYVVKLDKNGNILWHRDLGGTGADGADDAVDNGNGELIIAGATNSQDGDVTHPLSLNDQYWTIDIDSNQNIVWDKCYGGGGSYCFPNTICKATDGSIWMAGVSSAIGGGVDTAYGGEDAWILHTNSAGVFLNAKVLGSSMQDEAYMVYPLSNGSVISGGYYWGNNGSFSSLDYHGYIDIFLAVLSPWTTKVPPTQKTTDILSIFPNPATDFATITKTGNLHSTVEIYNSIGSMVYKTELTDHVTLRVSTWPKGVYCVDVVSEDGGRQVMKLVVVW